jgi:anaerobic C4-dicarboxylate transporter
MHVFSTVVTPMAPHVAFSPKFDPAHTLVLPVLSIFVHVAPSQQVFGYTPVDWRFVSSQISPICAVHAAAVVVVAALSVVVVPVPDVVVSELEQEEEHTFEQH